MANQDEPERLEAGRCPLGQGRAESLPIGVAAFRLFADHQIFGRRLLGGGLPERGPAVELGLVFGGTRGADHDEHTWPVFGLVHRQAQGHREQGRHDFQPGVSCESDQARPFTRRRPHSAERQKMAIKK